MIERGFEHAFNVVQKLATEFQENYDYFVAPDYSEAQARKDFIDKFLIALGWDVNHDEQSNPYEQEVKVERAVRVGAGQRHADYAFSIAPNFRDSRLIIEAKKPAGEIATADNYFQTVRYGWNKHNPVAGLTSFEEFHLLDCRYKPDIDTAIHRGLEKWTLEDYFDKEKFARLYWLISREAVGDGSLEKYAAELPKPRRGAKQRGLFPGAYLSIDESFLTELDEYRKRLAVAFKSENHKLDGETLTEATQRTLDRLVFMRFLEDKLIEPSHFVETFGERGTAWQDFVATSKRLNQTYNGIVFKHHDLLDDPKFKLDDESFAQICEELSHKNSPYDFDAIPIHILGSIYERFLGNVIVATGRQVRIEPKPEVRKAGGVYYTPEFIVRYIVANTVGKLIEAKTPADIASMRFADIACGSGSFLLSVFDLLIRHHAKYYNDHPRQARKGECVERDGVLHLSVDKKVEILLNNIYGVDIDPQAVEVTQLSLYLKLLEEETIASAHEYQRRIHAGILPTLNDNIVCGNSLIGTDILTEQLFPEEDERKLNPMDFAVRLPTIVHRGENSGFDAIVGNPPYVRIQGFPSDQIRYLKKHYVTATGNYDLYVNFVERSYSLVKPGGRVGYIVPNKFFKTDYGIGLRKLISENSAVTQIVDFGAHQVFDATTYTCLLFLAKSENKRFKYAEAKAATQEALSELILSDVPATSLTNEPWLFSDELTAGLRKKLWANSKRLLDLPAQMSRGSSSGNDKVFLIKRNKKIERDALRVPLFASDFNRYTFNPSSPWRIIFPYVSDGGSFRLLEERELKRKFPQAYEHLKEHKAQLKKRKQYAAWYGFSAPRNLTLHDRASICVPLLADHGLFALIPEDMRGKLCPMASGGFTITIEPSAPVTDAYVLGLLNSRLLFWELRQLSNLFRGGWVTCTKQYLGELPITLPTGPQQKQMVRLVESLVDAETQLSRAKSDKDKNYFGAKCATLDRQIDALVYELYGLTEDEIQMVEKNDVSEDGSEPDRSRRKLKQSPDDEQFSGNERQAEIEL